ncbi:uncharacterized protein B0H64DRAFT_99265 [Chaetomium fimeti]|uniref:Uncharacterized protein n=1 Tax=Chaetomium fimeti TaxID=1854472 RepID=A0AAE0HMP7_9PEZI|nr:hypothetical protein B0H64DRAFT_99265 [Chaetomium fimeti]
MGGKTWSRKEELVYWLELIPHSPKRLGHDLAANEEKAWNWVAQRMTKSMGSSARRKYTPLCVFEHYFQNTYLGRFSPNIGKLHLRYYRREQASKKKKEKERVMAEELEEARSDSSMTDASGDAEPPIKVDSNGDEQAPIVINCQYPTVPSYHTHAPAPRSTVPSAPASFAPSDFLPPPPPYHFHQFPANHDRLATTETEGDSPFMAQPPASGADDAAAPHRSYSYHHY